MPLISLCGPQKHADNFREVVNAPSVSGRLWHCDLRQPQGDKVSHREKELFCGTC